jgi:glycosyltransferase involved in cell wall biosynthesis
MNVLASTSPQPEGAAPVVLPDVPRPTLGVVAIARNEAQDLPGFLDHLLPWVDEIVIVDDGSTDRTADLARAAGPKVKFLESPRQPGEGYSHQRNKGIAAATSDWLLHMDIDERVTPELAAEIRRAIRNPSRDGYRYRRLDFSLHRPPRAGALGAWNHVQLARREKAAFTGQVHETLEFDDTSAAIGQLQGCMWHLKEADYVERVRKNLAYMQAEAERLLATGRPVRWYHFLIPPLGRALKYYLLRGGFCDGTLGVLNAMFILTGTFNWYATAWDRAHAIPRREIEAQLQARWREKGDLP